MNIFHELFHVASSIHNMNGKQSGFEQVIEKSCVGIGINEGYTQLLTERYFKDLEDSNQIYPYEVEISSLLENIIGRRTMEKLYLKVDLYGLIKRMEEYSDIKEIVKFISSLDYVSINYNNTNLTSKEISDMDERLDYIANYLLIIFLRKIRKEINNNKISIRDGANDILIFIKSIGSGIEFGGNKYFYSIGNHIQKYIDEIINTDKFKMNVVFNDKKDNNLQNKCK